MDLVRVDALPLDIPRGTSASGYVQLPIEPPVELPFTVVQGVRAGPRLLVTAGVHGAEYASIEAAVRLAKLNPNEVRGTLMVMPILNPEAYQSRSIYLNPVDRKNLNRVFPGRASGTTSERMAYWVSENVIRASSAYIDLHGGDLIESLVPFTLYVTGDQKARQLAQAFGVPTLVGSESSGTSLSAGHLHGIPSILAEAGGNGLRNEKDVRLLENGVLRVMQYLGMHPGRADLTPIQQIETFTWLRSEHAGLWFPKVKPGEIVHSGQRIGQITNPFGDQLQLVTAPAEGLVLFSVTSLAIGKGDPLFGIGH